MCVTLLAGYQREPTMSQSDANRGDILIVDDTLPNLRYLQALLTTRGYDVRGATSGQMALMVARNAPPDLILLDIKMPDLDGYDVCRQLKADTQTCDIPIIFISAMDAVLDKVKAFEAGGVDYITKPFQVDEIIARIENHLTIRVLQRQLQQANDELSLTNAELRQANQSLQASNEELDAFSRTMAYDLKNPFAAIIGYAELLGETFHDDPSPPAERLELIEQIMRSGRQGVRIVDALLMLARFRRDHVGIVFQNFHLVPTMTALENVAIPLEFAGRRDAFARSAEMLEAVGLGHRLSHLVIGLRQSLDLIDVEHRVAFHEGDLDLAILARIIGLGFAELISINDELTLGSFADLTAELECLTIGHPCGRGVAIGDGG